METYLTSFVEVLKNSEEGLYLLNGCSNDEELSQLYTALHLICIGILQRNDKYINCLKVRVIYTTLN